MKRERYVSLNKKEVKSKKVKPKVEKQNNQSCTSPTIEQVKLYDEWGEWLDDSFYDMD